jgi:hypothetical protein
VESTAFLASATQGIAVRKLNSQLCSGKIFVSTYLFIHRAITGNQVPSDVEASIYRQFEEAGIKKNLQGAVMLPCNLSHFLSRLRELAKSRSPNCEFLVNQWIAKFLYKVAGPDEFVCNIEKVLNICAPAGTIDNLRTYVPRI